MAGDNEEKPLIAERGDDVEWGKEFFDLCVMASQVSLATFCRIALTSIDSAFLGHLGTQELAAASLAQVWTSVPLMGVWAGASALITLCGQSWGANNRSLTGIWLQFGIIVTGIFGIPVFIWYWCISLVLQYSTEEQRIVELGASFGRVLSFSIAPSLVYACMRQYFQAMGIMWPTTVVGSLSIGVAAICNYVFIYGIGEWEGFGFVGSPLATVVACWFQPLALFLICVVWKGYHKQAWEGWDTSAYTWDRLITFLSIAGPMASNSFVSNLANSLVSLIAAKMGSNIIAANAVVSGLWGMLWAVFWGFGCATQVRVANYMGAGRPNSAKKLALLGFICTITTVIALGIIVLALHDKLFRIYTSDQVIIDLCLNIKWLFVGGFMIESTEILVSAVLTGMSKVTVIFWVSLLATWLIDLPLCWLLGLHYNMGLPALWIAIGVMEVFKLSVYLIDLGCTDWEERARFAMESMEAEGDEEQAPIAPEEPTPAYGAVSSHSRSMSIRSRSNSIFAPEGLNHEGILTHNQAENRLAEAIIDRRVSVGSPAHFSTSIPT
eukprot:comp21254_c0_seq1/m.28966 comp21254_c0_seq1/g.28966  ORF comp21254_c0_seq1/g.28966 comp21254_c0_seq1/m.28966 type:complete len:552 (-) comp21254_c0_seq1:439-2094(-)